MQVFFAYFLSKKKVGVCIKKCASIGAFFTYSSSFTTAITEPIYANGGSGNG